MFPSRAGAVQLTIINKILHHFTGKQPLSQFYSVFKEIQPIEDTDLQKLLKVVVIVFLTLLYMMNHITTYSL